MAYQKKKCEPLPDCVVDEPDSEGNIVLAANEKVRAIINEGFSSPVEWSEIKKTPKTVLRSPEYLAIEMGGYPVLPGGGPALPVLLAALHERGLTVLFWCGECKEYHFMTDELARAAVFYVKEHAVGVCPGNSEEFPS